MKGVKKAAPHFDLTARLRLDCDKQHPLDLTSCVAFCDAFQRYLLQLADSWRQARSLPLFVTAATPAGVMERLSMTECTYQPTSVKN